MRELRETFHNAILTEIDYLIVPGLTIIVPDSRMLMS